LILSKSPEISVIVLNWNGKQYLKECFESLKEQTFGDFVIYLVDNGSEDGSVDFVKENYPEVEIIALSENRGFAGGVNAGIRNSQGKFVALLNNDTKVSPRWLSELHRGIIQDEKTGICSSKMLFYYTPEVINAAGDIYRTDGVPENRGIGEKDEGQYDREEFVFGACAGAALYRRSMLEETGLFDEDYFESVEDADLSFRAQLMGYKCLYVPGALIYHVHMATVGKFSAFHFRNCVRNRTYTLIKNMPGLLILRYSFWIFMTYFMEFLSIVPSPWKSLEMKKAYFKAFGDVLKNTFRTLKKRRDIQKGKKVSNKYIASILTPMSFNYYFRVMRRFGKKISEKKG